MGNAITKRKIQAMNTKYRIFNTAVELINKNGYDNVSVDEICKGAGISVGCFYHHFKNKDDIIVESFKKIDEYFEDKAPHVLKCTNALDRIILYFSYFGQYVNDQGIDFTSQLVKSELSSNKKFTIDTNRSIFKILQKIVIEGQINNQIRNDLTAEKTAGVLLRYARGIALNWCINKGIYNLEKEIVESFELFVISLKPMC